MAYSMVRGTRHCPGTAFDSVLRDAEHRHGPGNHCLSSREWETRLSDMENVRHCRVFVFRSLGLTQAEQL